MNYEKIASSMSHITKAVYCYMFEHKEELEAELRVSHKAVYKYLRQHYGINASEKQIKRSIDECISLVNSFEVENVHNG